MVMPNISAYTMGYTPSPSGIKSAARTSALDTTTNPILPASTSTGNAGQAQLPELSILQLLSSIVTLLSSVLGQSGGGGLGSAAQTAPPNGNGGSTGNGVGATTPTSPGIMPLGTQPGRQALAGNAGAQNPVGGSSVADVKLDLPAERPKIDRSLVPPGGLNAGNIDQYAETLSKKFGIPKSLILAQVKKESGPNFTDLAHRGDAERNAAQGGPSVGPNQITEGVLTGGIWNGGAEGIDLTPQEAETNPALAMQAGLIHLTDYIKQDNGDLTKALGRYVGHDQAQYVSDINMYMAQMPT
jgi:hypothetical protein